VDTVKLWLLAALVVAVGLILGIVGWSLLAR
jgi:hypothetical protein